MKGAKSSRVDELYSRLESLERLAMITFEMANKTRHIMTRLEGYQEAYDKYQEDADKVREPQELNIDLTEDNAEDSSDRT
jgi:hypothetical protein